MGPEHSLIDRWQMLKRLLIQELDWNLDTLTIRYRAKLGELRLVEALEPDSKELSDELEIGIPEIGRYSPLNDEILANCFREGLFSPYITFFDDDVKKMLLNLLRQIRVRNGLLTAIQASWDLLRHVEVELEGKRHKLGVKYSGIIPLLNREIITTIKDILQKFREPKPTEKEFA
jgi:hypothetical protein